MDELTDFEVTEQFNKDYWQDYFSLCKDCSHPCKQSWKILELQCNKFEYKFLS